MDRARRRRVRDTDPLQGSRRLASRLIRGLDRARHVRRAVTTSRTRSLARLVAAAAFAGLLLSDASRSAGNAATTPAAPAGDLAYQHALQDARPYNEGPSAPAPPL